MIKHLTKSHKLTKQSNKTIKSSYKSSYKTLFEKIDKAEVKKDWELTHSYTDAILEKFISDILQNKYKTKKQIYNMASLINKKVLSKNLVQWFA